MAELIEFLELRRLFSGMTADFTALGGPLTKAGLGSLFGVTASDGGPNLGLLKGALLNTSVPADTAGVTSGFTFTLANVAPILRKVGLKTTVRYADMIGGFPYQWKSLADWDSKVNGETQAIKANFKDVVSNIAIFNEPDNTMQGAFLTDPALPAGTYDQKVNWLWTHTVQEIKAIDSTIPLMGPNYVAYYPSLDASQQARMKAFLQNAIATNTVPDVMGWHQLYSPAVTTYSDSVTQYRSLEASLGLPKLPLQVEEYGYNNGKFEGIPSAMLPWWAEFERNGVTYASAGVYDNGGTLGNTVDYFREQNQQPNAGWWMHNWYMTMSGQYVPTTSAVTRYSGAYDGVASFNTASRVGTVILGGPSDNASIYLKGVGKLIGGSVRVTLQDVRWTADANEPNSTLEHGGDPVFAPTTVFEKIYTPNASGDIRLNFHIEDLHGYRIQIQPAQNDTTPRYESENAVLAGGARIVSGAGATKTSNGSYVTGLSATGSSIAYNVVVPYNGDYTMNVGYGAAAAASQSLAVNNVVQPSLFFAATGGGPDTHRGTVTRTVALKAGVNTLLFAKLANTVDHDYVTIAPAIQTKYEAEAAVVSGGIVYTGGPLASGGGYVGGLSAGDVLAFNIVVPNDGLYDLGVRYAAGGGTAVQDISVNNVPQGQVAYAATTTNAAIDLRTTTKLVALRAGTNVVRLTRNSGDAEIDYVDVQPDTHRYEAETATFANANGRVYNNAYISTFWDFVGQIDTVGDSYVSWQVEAPVAGAYTVQVSYANGGGVDAADSLTLNNAASGTVSLPKTSGWFGSVGPAGGGVATLVLNLLAGTNVIKLARLANFAELNYLKVISLAAPSPFAPSKVRGQSITSMAAPPAVALSTPPSPPASPMMISGVPVTALILKQLGWSALS